MIDTHTAIAWCLVAFFLGFALNGWIFRSRIGPRDEATIDNVARSGKQIDKFLSTELKLTEAPDRPPPLTEEYFEAHAKKEEELAKQLADERRRGRLP